MSVRFNKFNKIEQQQAADQILELIRTNPMLTMRELREKSNMDKFLIYKATSLLSKHSLIRRRKWFGRRGIDYVYVSTDAKAPKPDITLNNT